MSEFPLFPESASTLSSRVDALFLTTLGIAVFFSVLIFSVLAYLTIRYRRRSAEETGQPFHAPVAVEITWTLVPLAIVMVLFGWGARVFFSAMRPPSDAIEFYVVGKQWMWKFQHPEGRREINELHVPVDQDIKLKMTSEDVIHSFFVPAFRVKTDVLPGRYTTAWFHATKPGVYDLYCAEYCGAEHSLMKGKVYVMEPRDYEAYLAGLTGGKSLAEAGAELFTSRACITCHSGTDDAKGPALAGLFGHEVKLQGGEVVVADESYLRESILSPTSKVVEGFKPIMPTYQGQLTEEEVIQLIAYIKTQAAPPLPPGAAPPESPDGEAVDGSESDDASVDAEAPAVEETTP